MTLILLSLLILAIVLNFPTVRDIKLNSYTLDNFRVPFFLLVITVLDGLNLFSQINDNLLLGYLLIFLISKKENIISSYIRNVILLFTIFTLVMTGTNTVWLTFLMCSISFLELGPKSFHRSLISAIILSLPAFDFIKLLYGQWGAFLILPAFIGIFVTKKSFFSLISGMLLLTVVSNTKYITLGYLPIILLGMFLLTVIGQSEKKRSSYVTTMALVPFVGISDPIKLVGIYILMRTSLFLKSIMFEITKNIEIENGAIKNIKYQEIVVLIISTYFIFAGPGTPLAWILSEMEEYKNVILFILFLDIFHTNGSVIEDVKNGKKNKTKKDEAELYISVLMLILLCFTMKDSIFKYSLYGLVFGTLNLILIAIFKQKPNWIDLLLNIKRSTNISFAIQSALEKDNIEVKNKENIDLSEIRLRGLDETVIWSLFIFLISILLVGRYL